MYGAGQKHLIVIDVQSKHSVQLDDAQLKNVLGQMREGDLTKAPEALDVGAMQVGQAYRIYNSRHQTLSDPFEVKGVTTDGIKRFEIGDAYNDGFILYNPDYEKEDTTEQLLGSCCRAFEIEMHTDDPIDGGPEKRTRFGSQILLGGKSALEEFIFGQGFGQGKIKKAGVGLYALKSAGMEFWSRPMNKIAATAYLMSRCHVRQDCAQEMLKKAEAAPVLYSFYYEPLEKSSAMGANMRFNDWPDFEAKTNNEFGVLEEPFSQHLLRVEQDRPDLIRSRMGDRWNQGSGDEAGQIDTATPLELYARSQQDGVGSMFEHGVVGELLKTYDAGNMVDKYLPDLEEGLLPASPFRLAHRPTATLDYEIDPPA